MPNETSRENRATEPKNQVVRLRRNTNARPASNKTITPK
jgi:hypothetical protein